MINYLTSKAGSVVQGIASKFKLETEDDSLPDPHPLDSTRPPTANAPTVSGVGPGANTIPSSITTTSTSTSTKAGTGIGIGIGRESAPQTGGRTASPVRSPEAKEGLKQMPGSAEKSRAPTTTSKTSADSLRSLEPKVEMMPRPPESHEPRFGKSVSESVHQDDLRRLLEYKEAAHRQLQLEKDSAAQQHSQVWRQP